MNIFDYLDWRGDLDFRSADFNDVDNLIMARISFFPLEHIMSANETISLRDAYLRIIHLNIAETEYFLKQDLLLFERLSKEVRYRDLILTNFVYRLDTEIEKQFAAVTIILPTNHIYVSYRGTDDTLVGFKEDFNLIFKTEIPAQKDALMYLNSINKNLFTKIYVGGHSKGGNLALYAAMYSKNSIKNRIAAIYNNDGPGFLEEYTTTAAYRSIKTKLYTFIPETSIIGRILHTSDSSIVKSKGTLIFQHDIYNWLVARDTLLLANSLDENSEKINKIINEFLNNLTIAEREKFVNTIYNLLIATNAKTLKDFDNKWFTNTKKILSSYLNISAADKEILNKVIENLFLSVKKTLMS